MWDLVSDVYSKICTEERNMCSQGFKEKCFCNACLSDNIICCGYTWKTQHTCRQKSRSTIWSFAFLFCCLPKISTCFLLCFFQDGRCLLNLEVSCPFYPLVACPFIQQVKSEFTPQMARRTAQECKMQVLRAQKAVGRRQQQVCIVWLTVIPPSSLGDASLQWFFGCCLEFHCSWRRFDSRIFCPISGYISLSTFQSLICKCNRQLVKHLLKGAFTIAQGHLRKVCHELPVMCHIYFSDVQGNGTRCRLFVPWRQHAEESECVCNCSFLAMCDSKFSVLSCLATVSTLKQKILHATTSRQGRWMTGLVRE